MSADDVESLHETLFWLSQHGILEDTAAADAEFARGEGVSGDQLRAEFGLA